MHPSHRAQKELLYLLISSLVVIICWIGFGIYNTSISSTITQDLQTETKPIDPDFDTATLDKLKTRQQVTPAFAITGTPQESPTPSAGASSSALLTPSASKSATSSSSARTVSQ